MSETTRHPQRLEGIDYEGFLGEINELKAEINESFGKEDYRHLKKIIWINRLCTLLGYATAWLIPNPISAYLISQGIFGRWLVMHHIGHGGYDRVPNIPKRYTSKVFAMGWRRYINWFDWLVPDAWNYEHNVLHHSYTGEEKDPDLVEEHAAFLRNSRMPRWLRYLFVAFISISWKIFYYAPNTLYTMEKNPKPTEQPKILQLIWRHGLNISHQRVRKLWLVCYLPYALVSFVAIPLCFLPLGRMAVLFVLINRLMAELMTNFHSFLVIGPNHTGEDIYRFDEHYNGKAEFVVNQVISSCNYNCGTERLDYLQIWLNYQIEHHLFPKLPMLKYRQYQPRVKALCEKYNIPYVQESVFTRFRKTVDIIVGKADMKQLKPETEVQLTGGEGLTTG